MEHDTSIYIYGNYTANLKIKNHMDRKGRILKQEKIIICFLIIQILFFLLGFLTVCK